MMDIVKIGALFFLFSILLSACGENDTRSVAIDTVDTATLVFSVKLGEESNTVTNNLARAASIDCALNGISTIQAVVYDSNDVPLANGGPWNCNEGTGFITGNMVGSNRKVVITANSTTTIYWGDVSGIMIAAGITTNIGPVTLLPGAPNPSSGVLHPLNDTGITWGGSYPNGNNTTCIGETINQQDCSNGRDVTYNDNSDGHAGFSFTKLDANGNDLLAAATEWNCVRDNVTGLIWEVKQGGNGVAGDEGLHDTDDEYYWYNSNPATNGGASGYRGWNSCYGYDVNDPSSNCNTQAYAARVNVFGLCGTKDWRMPTRTELRGLVNLNQTDMSIDTAYFPRTKDFYFSSSPYASNLNFAWIVSFYSGATYGSGKNYGNNRARLVRSGF